MRDALFALIWAVMFPISLWSAHVGVLLWIWIALISPGQQLYGVMSGIPYNKIVAISTLIVLVLNREKKSFYFDATIALFLILAVMGTLSAVLGIVDTPDGWDLYGKLIKILVLALVISGVMWSRHRLHMLLIVVCLGYGFDAVWEGLQFVVTAGGHKVLGTGSVGDNNSLATAILMIVPLLYYLTKYSSIRLVRIIFLGTMVLSILAIMATYSRGGFIGMVVLALFMLKNSRRKFRGALLIAMFAGLIVVAAPSSWYERLNTLNDAGQDGSFMERVTVWKISTLIAIDHPVFGGGFHAVQRWPVWIAYGAKLPFLEFINTPPPDEVPRAAHSSYFEILGDLGFSGLFLFLCIIGVSFLNLRRITRLVRTRADLAWAGDMAQMLQISLAVYIVTTIALSMAYFENFYIIVAVTSRLLQTVRLTIANKLPVEKTVQMQRADAFALTPAQARSPLSS